MQNTQKSTCRNGLVLQKSILNAPENGSFSPKRDPFLRGFFYEKEPFLPFLHSKTVKNR